MSIVSKIVAMRAIIRMQAIVAMFTAGRCFGDPKKCLDGEAEGGAGGEAGFNLVSYSECVWEMMITRSMMMMTKIMMMLKMMMMMMVIMIIIRIRTLMMMSCLSLRDSKLLLDLLGEESVVPPTYY